MCLKPWNGLQIHMWHHLHSPLRHNWQYVWFWNTFTAPSFFTRPPIFLLSCDMFLGFIFSIPTNSTTTSLIIISLVSIELFLYPANKEAFLSQLACVVLVHNWYRSTSTCFRVYSCEYTCSDCCHEFWMSLTQVRSELVQFHWYVSSREKLVISR